MSSNPVLAPGYRRFLLNHQNMSRKQYEDEGKEKQQVKAEHSSAKTRHPDQALYRVPGRSQRQKAAESEENTTHQAAAAVSPVLPRLSTLQLHDTSNECVEVVTERGNRVSLDVADINIPDYSAKSRELMPKAIKDPKSIMKGNLEYLAEEIVEKAVLKEGYYKIASDLCFIMCEKERDSEKYLAIPTHAFSHQMAHSCQEYRNNWELVRSWGKQNEMWIRFVKFLTLLYKRQSENKEVMGRAGQVLYPVITDILLTPRCFSNSAELQLLLNVFTECGQYICEHSYVMGDKLMGQIRDILINEHLEVDQRVVLMYIIELYASDWRLSEDARLFYHSSLQSFFTTNMNISETCNSGGDC